MVDHSVKTWGQHMKRQKGLRDIAKAADRRPTQLSEEARRPICRFALLIGALLIPASSFRAQQPQISVQVKAVNVLATVRDNHGQIVSNLSKDDFVLEEDGRPQTITYFARETDLPLTLGLVVDTSLSQQRVIEQERAAGQSFLSNMLRQDKDQAFVIHFDREVELLQDLTSSVDVLARALRLLEISQPDRNDGASRSGRGGGTLLYDAVYLASNEEMKKQQGRKALIVLTDGVDRGSKESLETAIETAQAADTVVYSILFADDRPFQRPRGFGMGGGGRRYPQQERPDGKKVLERISRETGGRLFEVSGKQTIQQIFSSIEEELRNQYNLGYTPRADVGPGYHKIAVTTKQKDLVVQARDGYYATP